MKKKCIIICILITLIVFVSGITYSLFDSGASSNTNVDLASFLVDAKKTNHIDLPLDNVNPGDKVEYDFQVENNSDVNVLYNISIKTMHFIPFDISLKDENDNEIMVCDENVDRNLHNELECVSSDIEIDFMERGAHNYKLVLDFPKKYSSEDYSSLVDYINLEINSTQKID